MVLPVHRVRVAVAALLAVCLFFAHSGELTAQAATDTPTATNTPTATTAPTIITVNATCSLDNAIKSANTNTATGRLRGWQRLWTRHD